MGKVDSNKKQKRDALLDTAFGLFTSKGINKTSISDIVDNAGVAKGTFYLYFKDKYDIRNKLIAHKASEVFKIADEKLHIEMKNSENELALDDKVIFLVNDILDQFCENKLLLNFISKNLSWGIFKNVLSEASENDEVDFFDIYRSVFEDSKSQYENPELMIYMIIELASSTCYSAILYNEPVSVEELKPYLFRTIRQIMKNHEKI